MTLNNPIEPSIEEISSAIVPTAWGEFVCHVFEDHDGVEQLTFVYGKVDGEPNVLVRVHSECLTGDIFRSLKCDCGPQLHASMEMIADNGQGILVYMRGHEGRGIGIGKKIEAYSLQEQGMDTVQANEALGLPVDDRNYSVSGEMIKSLGVTSIRLITNNPAKVESLESVGVVIAERISMPTLPTVENISYLHTKNNKMGHLIDGLDD